MSRGVVLSGLSRRRRRSSRRVQRPPRSRLETASLVLTAVSTGIFFILDLLAASGFRRSLQATVEVPEFSRVIVVLLGVGVLMTAAAFGLGIDGLIKKRRNRLSAILE